jgi:hypothetical protein
MVSYELHNPGRFTPGKVRWVPEPVWALQRREQALFSSTNQTLAVENMAWHYTY